MASLKSKAETSEAVSASLDSTALNKLANAAEAELKGNILAFWMAHAKDAAHKGFYGELSEDLKVNPAADRGALLTSRILWTFSAAYLKYKDPAYLDMANWAYEDLTTHFADQAHGGFVWSVTSDGKPKETDHRTYGQAFAIYGLSEYYLASRRIEALQRAIETYRLLERYARDPIRGGYLERFGPDWKRDLRSPFTGTHHHFFEKSQNTHLHVMEAYANLLRAWPDAQLSADLRSAVEDMLTKVIVPSGKSLGLFFDADWHVQNDTVSFGHDIEASWLLCEAAAVLRDSALEARTKKAAMRLVEATLADGVDRDGGVWNEGSPGGLIDSDKEWWNQAEAAVGFLNAYKISGDSKFFEAYINSWNFIQEHVVDRSNGEWYHGTKADGSPQAGYAKISLWKCPYHNGRSCMEIVDRLSALQTQSPGQ